MPTAGAIIPILALIWLTGFPHEVRRSAVISEPPGMALIPAGSYTPLFRAATDPTDLAVASFYLDVLPVTNGDFLEFVRRNPRWRRSQVKRLFAEADYLK